MPILRAALLACLALLPVCGAPRPKLVVVISVDQLSEELMERWGQALPGGLGRLYREGSTFLDAYQEHGATETGPGHSVLLTGRDPMHTGIIGNQWPDPATGRPIYCVADPACPVLGAPAGGAGASARFLEGSTIGGWLHQQVPGSRMFAVTGKDRSAILMAGREAEGVYWFAGPLGFTSSTAYTQALPTWLLAYDRRLLEGLTRDPLLWSARDPQGMPPAASYVIHGKTVAMGLPRTLRAAGAPLDAAFWKRYAASPFLDESIMGAAQALEEGEGLGTGMGVDLLALGLSATDYVGHTFGNGGPEMLDNLRRLDLELGRFLKRLQARVPGVWVVLTADHGAADFPERRLAQGLPAQRVDPAVWEAALNKELSRRLGGSKPYFRPMISEQLSLDPEAVRASGHRREQILEMAAKIAKASPEIQEAFSSDELEAYHPGPATPDRLGFEARMRLSYRPGRSGDLLVAFKPFTTLGDSTVGGHGSPHDYDRRVPLIFWGPWKAELHHEPVSLVDLAPTLARELGISPGELVDGKPLKLR
jgi:predicted AlkP superfamily pyrophosphatase or phosphodiesterase